jgi:hypothetical protein
MLTRPSADFYNIQGLRDSEQERGEPQRFKFLCRHNIGVTATQALTCLPIMSRHYAGMTQDALRIAGTLGGGGGGVAFPSHAFITPP